MRNQIDGNWTNEIIKQRPVKSNYPQSGISRYVEQASNKFEVQCFVGSSVIKIPIVGSCKLLVSIKVKHNIQTSHKARIEDHRTVIF
jgi:hypothetical protein